MILSLAGKYRKGIAWFMTGVFYLQFILPFAANGATPVYFPTKPGNNYSYPIFGNRAFNDFPPIETDKAGAEEKPGVENLHKPSITREEKADKANIGGPGQPEMSSFQSVNGGNLVDLFSGDFSYNIPLMDVGGYPINIHYNSGVSMDQEASWVGLGWNVNPGSVTRNMRGLPDDFNGTDSITKTQHIKVNKTAGVKLGAQAEIAGAPLTVGAGFGVFHNNYNGWGIEQSLNAAISVGLKSKGHLNSGDSSSMSANVGLGINNNSQTGLSVSPSLNVNIKKIESLDDIKSSNYGISTNYHSRAGLASLTIDAQPNKLFGSLQRFIPNSVSLTFAQRSVTPTISMPTTAQNFVFHAKTGGEAFSLHGNVYVEGYVNKQEIRPEDTVQKLPSFGYLYYTDANNNAKALLDYNREKEVQFAYKSTPHIAIPQYTYDVYSISGEGTGGTIRPYRGDAGYVRDHYMRTKSNDDQFSVELGFGNVFHGGFSYDFVRAFTENSAWNQQNNMRSKLAFLKSDSLYQSVYFRNPGEKTSNTAGYYQQIGDDALLRIKLDRSSLTNVRATNSFLTFRDGRQTGTLGVNNNIIKKDRDKRSQVVTYLNAEEASLYGLDKKIYSFKENSIPVGSCQDTIEVIERIDHNIHKKNHLSEIDVLNADGRRYVYGTPAYNIEQKDVTFSVNKETNSSNIEKGLVHYNAFDNTPLNNKGKESYFNAEKIPAFAHSFLLTGILSPDYVDIKGDGITDDDLGDAVRFNYTRTFGPSQGYFEWRTPGTQSGELNLANYNEGFKTYSRDDKGTYLYGKKEVWYTHSIESKTMIALFKISNARKDAYATASENGGMNVSKSLRRLDAIELYTKADLLKNGKKARPIKTVHFEYSYDLTPNYAGNSGQAEYVTIKGQSVNVNAKKGKLTLKKIWFSYNGNDKGKQNPYTFNYSGENPNYHPKKYDRWGNYKDPSANPGGLNNADFPYTVRSTNAVTDSTIAAQNAGVWNLTDIKLPSGGRMKISYEADDYAYVQNKRAQQMFTIAGFGNSPTATPSVNLYAGQSDYEYVFINSPLTIDDTKDVFRKYLDGSEWLYMKMAVNVPTDRWGSGYEFIPVYGKVVEYGKVSGANRFWVRFEKVQGVSPMVRAALQFLKNNLTSKAYPTSELGDNVDFGDAVKMLLSSIGEIKNSVLGFESSARGREWCKKVEVAKSFIRLNSPDYKKFGGGLRVKRVEIFDNWDAMTKQRQSIYGQEYNYRTSIEVDGKKQIISSGVATYEPMIGGEENPFRQPINYSEKLAPLAPVAFLYSEMPLGESYFPGPSVGYSKVRVRTINAKAKSANGWEETEFYTSKDFPTIVEHTLLDQDAKARYKPKLQNLLKIKSVERTTVSQGFKIELNDMNGKVKSTASFAENDSLNPIAYSLNFYKVDDDRAAQKKLNNTVWVVDSINGKINKNGIIGKDIELMTDFRQQFSNTISGGLSPNMDYFQIGIFPVPMASFFKFPQFDESLFRSAATVKVIQRYGILDSVVVMDKGSIVSTKNLLYDGETGEVVLSRTSNEFNDPIYNFSYAAHWAYSGMGMAYKNIDAVFSNLRLLNGKLYQGIIPFPTEKYFESGDEFWITGKQMQLLGGDQCLDFNAAQQSGAVLDGKMWAIDATKGKENNRGLYFIDKEGRPVTGQIYTMKVIRSGKRNMLDASAGSIIAMENPIRETSSGNYKLVIDSTIRVVNAAVSTYKDIWKVENSLYETDSCYTVLRTANSVNFYPEGPSTIFRIFRKKVRGKYDETFFQGNINSSHYVASSLQRHWDGHGRKSHNYDTKSLLKFNLTSIPTNSIINSATLNLSGNAPQHAWDYFSDPRNEVVNSFRAKTYAHYKWGSTNGRTNESYIKQVIVPVNSSTTFSTLYSSGTSSLSQAPDQSCDPKSTNVTSMVQYHVRFPLRNYGVSIELTDYNTGNESNSSERTLSFCQAPEAGTFAAPSSSLYSFAAPAAAVPTGCVNCNASAVLTVNYSYYKDTCVKVCRNNINDSLLNPYRWGVFGNWRMDRAYTYYYDRKETDANNQQSDIRKEGVLSGFIPFWKLTDSVMMASSDTTKWVWNSAMSAYNRKGFETENYDPLGRYNSGLYGYNQTLPIAVGQNTRYREMLFDGFEDYGYKTKNCTTCDSPREFDFIKNQSGITLNELESHTGKYSVKVNAGAQSTLTVPVIASNLDSAASLSLKVDSTPVYHIEVNGKGGGLLGTYTGKNCNNNSVFTGTRIDTTINFNWGNTSPFPGMCLRSFFSIFKYDVAWQKRLQAPKDGYYRFYLDVSGIGNVTVTRTKDNKQVSLINPGTNGEYRTDTLYLQAGEMANLEVRFSKFLGSSARIKLSWTQDATVPSPVVEVIPKRYLYTATADTSGSVSRNVKFYCIKLNNPKPRQVIRPTFSPAQGKQLVVSAWVKMEGADCNVAPALTDVVVASFNTSGNSNTVSLLKRGVRIEGWQRYESVVDVPADATQMYLRLKGAQGRNVFFDDVRVQPYNSNMKSYVYDPVSLRLMAELDENNYAALYEYDDDGTLIRVKKETEKGIMTIKETRSALIKKDND